MAVKATQSVNALAFVNDQGERQEFGRTIGDWTDVKAPVDDAYLVAIQGKQGTHSIESITFVWVYYA